MESGKKLKNWFKKQTVKLLKKCIDFKKFKDPDACAYTAAKFKRKLDEIFNTGNIEDMLSEFDKNLPKDKKIDSFENFKERIRYYHYNKKAKPQNPNHNRYNQRVDMKKNHNDSQDNHDLEKYPIRAVIGGVEVFCGCLIGVLPFPGCRWLATALISHGSANIFEGYMQQYEEEHQKN